MSSDCEKIERELNSLLRDMAAARNDTLVGATSFPQATMYETDFPPINSSHRYNRKQESLSQVPNNLSHFVQEGKSQQVNRRYNKRFNDEYFCRQQSDHCEHNTTKRKDYVIKHKPQKQESRREVFSKKQVHDRKLNESKLGFDCSNLQSLSTLGAKMKDKEIKVLSAEDIETEKDVHLDSSIKFKSYKRSNRDKKKKVDQPRTTDDKKIQANIFLSALTEASSVGETAKKDKVKKAIVEDKVLLESEGTAHTFKDKVPAVSHCDTETYVNLNSTDDAKTITSTWTIADDNPDSASVAKVPLTNSTKNEDEGHPQNTDEFIRRCNKPSCNCSEDSLYCTLCDFHMSNPREFERHRKQLIHDVRKKDYFRVKNLEALNLPSNSQLTAIEGLLYRIYTTHAHAVEDGNLRRQIIQELRDDLQSEIEEDCKFHLFGSSVNGFGHKDSNINIDLEVPQGLSPSKMLLKTLDALKERENKYGNVVSDFTATFPSVSFIDRRTKLPCEITLNNDASRKTSYLLKQYAQFDDRVQKLGVIFRIWAKVCGIDQQEYCSLPPYCFPIMVLYFLQQTEPPVLPVYHDMTAENDVLSCDMKSLWTSRNKQTIAELWIDLLRFYAVTFKYKMHVICVRQKKLLFCKDKKWTTRMMCIEDPYNVKRNVARTIANPQWFQYILECIRCSFEYFCTCKMPKSSVIAVTDHSSNDEEDESSLSIEENSIDSFFEEQDNDLEVQSVVAALKALDVGITASEACRKNRNRAAHEQHNSTECIKNKDTLMEKKHCNNEMTNLQTCENSCDAKESSLYKFEKSHLINAKSPALFCRQCQKINHVKKNCTIDDKLPEMKKLPKMDKDHREMLSEACEMVYWFCRPTIESIQENQILLDDLQRHIQYIYNDAKLELFGSSCNGFGFEDSDLDICLTFHNKSGEDLDQKSIIERLTRELSRHKRIQNIIPIPTAKVPIIKFSFSCRKEGDISLYNTLGQHNTRLLATYCKIDKRVQLLGYTLKFFAKKCDICDASRGSLSSYAYILMTIFYLQQLEIPVIPVLQELYDQNERMPERYVDNCNTWFFEDIDSLPCVWQDYGKNKQSLGELWMGLIIYYTERFKMTEYVISIRQKAPLTRFEKLWNTRSIAIEDPFDHSHNLGAGVSRNMNTFIVSAFRRGREQFGRIPPARRDIPNLMEYFFNSKILTGGEKPPNERGCRHCLKIGHKMKECPLRRENFKRRNFERRNNNNKASQQRGNLENRNNFTDRYRDDRHNLYDARGGKFRANWNNFGNNRDRDGNTRRRIANSDIQSS